MDIKGKVHCFFEQSGTFKNEFIKMGIHAEDYDIQNNFNETDHVVDLFAEIEAAYDDKPSIFDNITPDDLIVAFFPCIYFSTQSMMNMLWNCCNYKKLTTKQTSDNIIRRAYARNDFYVKAIKMLTVAKLRGLRLIMENPWTHPSFLKNNFVLPPTIIDNNRLSRGDFFEKPTAYWYINCEPTYGESYTRPTEIKKIKHCKQGKEAGICSEERSMISKDYARNFI